MKPATIAASSTYRPSTPAARPGEEVTFIARQPIFDSDSKAVGYELLFRSGNEDRYSAQDGNIASSHTISRALHTIGLDAISGGKRIFINFTRDLIVEEVYTLLPPGKSVVELLETTVVDDEVIAACHKLKEAGYELALDDVTYSCKVNPLLKMADYLKIDFRTLPREDRRSVVSELSRLPAKLLAEKVETKEDFDEAVALGCSLVQGYFFARPELLKGKGLIGLQSIYVQFLQELNRPQLDFGRLEELIKKDASLTYKLLRYLNSAAMGVRNKIESVKQALVLMGERPLRKWGTLVAITSICGSRPPELLLMCLARARFCENIAVAENMPQRQLELFLIGMLSGIDALLDQPMASVLGYLAVPDAVRAVLLEQPAAPEEPLRIYKLAQACERGAWGMVLQTAAGLRQTQSEIAMAYYESLTWADQIFSLGRE